MNEQKMLDGQVREWETEGRWIDRGRWIRASNGTLEYVATPREIAAKCRLLRTMTGWQGAATGVRPLKLQNRWPNSPASAHLYATTAISRTYFPWLRCVRV